MIHVIVAVFAVLGTLWALAVWIVGGFAVVLPGMTIQSHDPLPPLALGVVAGALSPMTGGGPLPDDGRRPADCAKCAPPHGADRDSPGALPGDCRDRAQFMDRRRRRS